MHNPIWLQDRRWRWRVIVLVTVLAVVGGLVWLGQPLLTAVGAAAIIFMLAAKVGDWIIDSPASPAPMPPADTPSVADNAPEVISSLTAQALETPIPDRTTS